MVTAAQTTSESILSSYTFPDADGDGIDDRWDQCLTEKENYNDFLDTDGCPDVPGVSKPALSDI